MVKLESSRGEESTEDGTYLCDLLYRLRLRGHAVAWAGAEQVGRVQVLWSGWGR